ncbi:MULTISPECIES: murein biosynthesis integral membrane protein MurJ [Rahnella]|uniref:Murein biosynthesis integral membrane protein MurJ n=1 Tax=Rahnella sp. (strain Y9602) TaxID=2703885 RepID=A0ABW6CD23_RAHSY|nr:lipid II flippase MurJ [Rahnella aceris]MDP9703388.1 putative peptidoglycan lipid II flippase [Rahnella aquatilis]NIA89110.1 virulence factor MviN [Rahnella aceris]
MRKAIVSLISGNLLSKALGLIREVIVAALFGTGYINGAYRVAQTGTLVPVNFLVSDSLTAFIPLYKKFHSESVNKGQLFFWSMQVIFLIFSVILTSCAILFVDFWLNVIAPGLDERTRDLSRSMLIIMSLGITLYLSSALINYVEMAHDDFLPMSMRPSIQNFGMLLGALFAYIIGNPIYLAWGFTFSYLVFFIWVLIRGLNKGILNLPEKIDSKTLKSVILNFWRTLRPLIFLPFLYQGNIAVERAVATLISITAVSALDYAKFITETLLLVVSTPVALAGLASWGGLQPEHIKARLIETFSLLILFAVPVSLFLGVHANLVVTILFARGKFDSTSIEVTTHILQGMSLGLWANVISYVLIKALNAQFNNKKVMLIMTLGLIVNASFNILFYQFFKEMTLGLGYSLYGIITLAGCIYSLGIWGETSKKFYIIILSSCIYMLISSYEIPISNLYLNFLINGVLFLIFWSAVITLIPSLRGSFAGMIRHKRG